MDSKENCWENSQSAEDFGLIPSRSMSIKCDVLIVGAGYAGLVMAERICSSLGKSCLVIEKRDHIGGNAQDEYDEAGVLVHKYGPHYFRTNSEKVKSYLSQFTEWLPTRYQILSHTRDKFWRFPVNLNTFEQYLDRASSSEEFENWLESQRVPIEKPSNSEEVIISQIGWELYELFFKGYTKKQWKLEPKDLDPSVCGRIPIRTNRNDDYLKESFQALPKDGYHVLFKNIVDKCGSQLSIKLNTDYRDVIDEIDYQYMVYTGPIDLFYNFQYGKLPYRSLRFENESYGPKELEARREIAGKKGFFQPAMQVNYPNEEDYTRIVEIKHATRQQCENTTIVKEYPMDFSEDSDPYYPIPNDDSQELYKQYNSLADLEKKVSFIGRLATYKYYNMDQVVAMALKEFERISPELAKMKN